MFEMSNSDADSRLLASVRQQNNYSERRQLINTFGRSLDIADPKYHEDSSETELSQQDRWDIYSDDSQLSDKLEERLDSRRIQKHHTRVRFKQAIKNKR